MSRKQLAEYEAEIVQVIEENNVKWKCDIFVYYKALCRAQFYRLGLDKSDKIKKALEDNIDRTKATMRDRWSQPDANPTLQLAVYKLMATPEERDALSTNSKIEAKVEGDVGLLIDFKD